MSALEGVLVDKHLHLALQVDRYAHRLQQLQAGAVHLYVGLLALQPYPQLPVRWTYQPPVAARLKHPDLQLAVADAAALQFGALEAVNVAQSQRHYPFLALLTPQLFRYLLLVALLVLEYYRQNSSARLK